MKTVTLLHLLQAAWQAWKRSAVDKADAKNYKARLLKEAGLFHLVVGVISVCLLNGNFYRTGAEKLSMSQIQRIRGGLSLTPAVKIGKMVQ
jgi:hypothetical protein